MKSFFSLSRLLVLAALVLAPLALRAQTITGASGQVGVAYSYQVTSTATPPVVYSATNLPAGLAINASSGLITGVPTTAGTRVGTVSVTSNGLTNSAPISITITAGAGTPSISSATTASATVGTAFGPFAITATVPGGAPPVTSFTIGALPAGLSVGGTATAPTIAGTPTVPTTGTPFQVSLSANNDNGPGTPVTLSLTIAPAAAAPTITSSISPAPVAIGGALSYQITATNSPTSFGASGLPAGVSLSASGLISGTPTVGGLYPVSVSATNASGTGATVTVTFAIGVPAINSPLAATGTVGSNFSYALSASPAATSYNVGTLPPGLSVSSVSGAITGVPSVAGVTSVSVSANSAAGTGVASTLVFTINAATTGGGGGGGLPGGGGGGGGGGTTGPAPVIATQPASQSVVAGSTVTFSVSATGIGLNFQWSKNGVILVDARSATLTLTNVTSADAGVYVVFVSNTGGGIASSGATLTVTPRVETLPVVVVPVAPQTVVAGGSITLSATVTGNGPFTYQWQKDGTAVAGATNATLSLSNVTAASAGAYRLVATNSAGSTTSNPITLTVTPVPTRPIAGTYLGTFGGNGGGFALMVRSDGTGVFLGHANAARLLLLRTDVTVDANGNFAVTQPDPRPTAASVGGDTPPTAAHEGEFHINGTIAADGSVSGTVSGLNLTFSAPSGVTTGTTANVAGFYQAGAIGGSAQSYAVVSPAGRVLMVNVSGLVADGGTGTVSADGAISLTTAANAIVTGTVGDATLATAVSTNGIVTNFAGASDARTDTEKLINISTRSQTGTTANTLIAGFVISGDAPKPVLVRAIGPTLGSAFGVSGALSAARLEIFRGQTVVAAGNDWGTPAAGAPSAATIAATAARVGAFALAANSRDASLLLTLEPGAYTAVVTGQNGVSGVSLVEVYDATEGAIPRDRRIINIATRATAGTGDNALIAGFYVSGTVPKRLLIRGVGPALAQFGVAGTLARPQLTVNSGTTVVAQNAGWSTSPDAATIATSSAQVGAFAFPASSADAALIVHLAPGAYTAQVAGVANTTGVALVEVYELP